MLESEKEFQIKWSDLVERLSMQFEADLDYDGIIFLIGIQELGKGKVELKKDQKMDVMHIAVCVLLSQYNYYSFIGFDEDGWPHYEATEEMPYLSPVQQHRLIKEAILMYFENLI